MELGDDGILTKEAIGMIQTKWDDTLWELEVLLFQAAKAQRDAMIAGGEVTTKYGAKPTIVDNIRFASKREAQRYQELKLLERAGEISELELQTRFKLEVNGILITTYVADFVYRENGELVVEDCKGYRTREYRIKKQLMDAIWCIAIYET